MAPYKFIVAYEGTDFQGFQRQNNGPTIQKVIEDALKNLGWQERTIKFAGRTDVGTHAAGQVISFSLDWKHSVESLKNAINALLPSTIVMREGYCVHSDFHPRYDAKYRTYQYQIYCDSEDDPLLERFAWRVWPKPNNDLLNETAEMIIGTYDFKLFGRPVKEDGSTERKVSESVWISNEQEKKMVYQISADAFLYHMVRRIVYIIVRIGQMKIHIEALIEALQGKNNNLLPGIAPAKGLTLKKVEY